jgi:hypothetical protein
MRFFYDLEFCEDGWSIEPISIGIVSEAGDEYYAVFDDVPIIQVYANDWLVEHVMPYIPTTHATHAVVWPAVKLDPLHPDVKKRTTVRAEIEEFLLNPVGGRGEEDIELWADCGAYDHVALMQLWGTMVDKPAKLPYFTHDLMQEWHRLGKPELPQQAENEHHALYDARHDRDVWHFLDEYAHLSYSNQP